MIVSRVRLLTCVFFGSSSAATSRDRGVSGFESESDRCASRTNGYYAVSMTLADEQSRPRRRRRGEGTTIAPATFAEYLPILATALTGNPHPSSLIMAVMAGIVPGSSPGRAGWLHAVPDRAAPPRRCLSTRGRPVGHREGPCTRRGYREVLVTRPTAPAARPPAAGPPRSGK